MQISCKFREVDPSGEESAMDLWDLCVLWAFDDEGYGKRRNDPGVLSLEGFPRASFGVMSLRITSF